MAKVQLAHIQQAASQKNEGLLIEGVPGGDVRLLSPLKMSKDKRKKLVAAVKAAEAAIDDPETLEEKLDLFETALRLAAEDKAAGDRLMKVINGDLAVMAEIFTEYAPAVNPGEASPSPS